MPERVYIETSVISLLAARPSRDALVLGNQQHTLAWWHDRRQEFELYVSALVLTEIRRGDPDAARKRLEFIADVPVLQLDEAARDLARRLVRATAMPREAEADTLHVAAATLNGMDYLLSWNLRHIAGAEVRRRIEAVCLAAGYRPPVLCTPADFVEGS